MQIRYKVQAQAAPIIRQMAKEAGVTVNDMGEIALYALIASWQKDKGVQSVEGGVEFSDTPLNARLP